MNRRNFIKTSGTVAALTAIAPAVSLAQSPTQKISPSIVKAMKDRIVPIAKTERLQRMEQAQKLMFENKLDAVFMEGGTSLNYFTGASWGRSERLFGMLLFQKGEPIFIAPKFEEGRAKEQTGDAKLFTWEENESPYALIKKIMGDRNLLTASLGLEETIRYFVTENLGKNLSSLKMQPAKPVIAGCRSIKSQHEIELMQIANDITAEVYKAAVQHLKEGMGERELGGIVSNLFAEFGADGGALVLFGEASAYPHGLVKESKLKQGDIVLIDGGCTVQNYESDITRTTVFGKPTDKMKTVWSIVRNAQDAGLKAAKPDVAAEDVDAAARKIINDSGYGPGYKYFTHRLGHGIGMDGHEWFYLVGGNKYLLKTGNMFSNEPGIYIPGEFGIRIEDEMLITETGAKLLLPQQESLEKIFKKLKEFMATKKEKSNVPEEKLEAYRKLISTNPKIELKGATIPYTSFNGHMFSYFKKDGTFGLRLPEKLREEFLKKYKTTPFISYGIVKKEFVLVPEKLLMNFKEFKPYFDMSFDYVKAMNAK